jgi:iron-sulfur cluster repair protein YtfE (RIC family)
MTEHIKTVDEITSEMTVNEIITKYPATVSVFSRHGIDSCCGGALPLSEVARKHRLEFIALLAELEQA